jgi:hypothetical protein
VPGDSFGGGDDRSGLWRLDRVDVVAVAEGRVPNLGNHGVSGVVRSSGSLWSLTNWTGAASHESLRST